MAEKSRVVPQRSEIGSIAIEGVIGVGKTSLARLLARDLNARLNLEAVDENPFLPHFYENPRHYAFATQIFFLLSRFRQQQQVFQQDLFQTRIISDYLFAKDRIFAHLNLDDAELALYERVANELAGGVPVPDLVVYLQASVDVLMTRIGRRGRDFERDMPRSYIETLSEAYKHFFFHFSESPLLVVNTNEIDFVRSREHYEDLRRHILEPFQGVRSYTPSIER